MGKVLVWFRNDLRIHDQTNLVTALAEKPDLLIPVYCFDERQFNFTSFGFPKTGKFRAKFLLESVANLKNSLQNLGSNLVIRKGLPEQIIPQLATQYQIDTVYFSAEATDEEIKVEQKLITQLKQEQIKIKTCWQSTLYHPHQLPFSPDELPDLFTNFRQQVEKNSEIAQPLPTPDQLPPLPAIELGYIPSLENLGLSEYLIDKKSSFNFVGGETEAINRLNHYFWQTDCLAKYKETRNGMLRTDYSSKFSPWLANGCLSPRFIYREVKKYEQERIKNDSTYWLVFELMWRDFFRFTALKYGNKLFAKSGLQNIHLPWSENWQIFALWCEGQTGYPLVDANMRELQATGFMSNRGRQNVASFLTKNLGINWQMGAEWFESLLIDYDVCSNWGNWNYTAGIGNDARGFRYFNIPKQSQNYDAKGDYLRHWLPELAAIKGDKIHQPEKLSPEEQKRFRVQLGRDYPRPIVDFFQSVKHNEKIYLSMTT